MSLYERVFLVETEEPDRKRGRVDLRSLKVKPRRASRKPGRVDMKSLTLSPRPEPRLEPYLKRRAAVWAASDRSTQQMMDTMRRAGALNVKAARLGLEKRHSLNTGRRLILPKESAFLSTVDPDEATAPRPKPESGSAPTPPKPRGRFGSLLDRVRGLL